MAARHQRILQVLILLVGSFQPVQGMKRPNQWGARVKAQLAVELAGLENVTVIALAGEQYRVAVHNSRWPVEIPMKGLGIGQQLGWLTEKLSGGLSDG